MRTNLIIVLIICLQISLVSACSNMKSTDQLDITIPDDIKVLHLTLRINKSAKGLKTLSHNQEVKALQGMTGTENEPQENGSTFRCEIRDEQNKLRFTQFSNFTFSYQNEKGGKDALVKFRINLPREASHVNVCYKSQTDVWQEVYSAPIFVN